MIASLLCTFALASPATENLEVRNHRVVSLPEPSIHPRRFEWVGELRRDEDGGHLLVQAIPLALRVQVSKGQRRPLASVPKEVARELHLHPGGPSSDELKRWLGATVKVELGQDSRGDIYIFGVEKTTVEAKR